jgi:DNA repair protein RAD16
LPSLAPIAATPLTRASRATILSRIPADRIGRGFRSSTKLEALLQRIHTDRTADPGSKCIIFSQFVSFLDLIQHRLALAGIRAVRLDGRMSAKARGRVIDAFKSDPGITAFCISLKAGGVALNLTEANRAYILDSWWNPAAELQAMDRTHRVGQHRSIQVVRFVVPGTIEEKVVALQEKKRLVFQATVGQDNKSLARLTEQDMRYLFSR